MQIIHPQSASEILERDKLLQASLREPTQEFAIASEYPIVLSPHENRFSYCLKVEEKICAHSNLWPRYLDITGDDSNLNTKISVGLVGNVATLESWRNQGLSKTLFTHLFTEAQNLGLIALVLWSDLSQFYQKLGFRSLSQEYRYFLETKRLANNKKEEKITYALLPLKQVCSRDLQNMLQLRQRHPVTIQRNEKEFMRLLQIPQSYVFVRYDKDQLTAFAIIGKGADMLNVVHEWGAKGFRELRGILHYVGEFFGLEEFIFLSPNSIAKEWDERLKELGAVREDHPMALVYELDKSQQVIAVLDKLFVWGLDAI